MQKNTEERDRPQMKIWRMRAACWIHVDKATPELTVCNNYYFSTTTIVAPAHYQYNVILKPTVPILLTFALDEVKRSVSHF
jgi:hypothetical protein